jgi:hypothetical protein
MLAADNLRRCGPGSVAAGAATLGTGRQVEKMRIAVGNKRTAGDHQGIPEKAGATPPAIKL